MKINIIGNNIPVTPRIRKLVDKKIGTSLDKYLPNLNREIKTGTMDIRKHSRWGYVINFEMYLPQKYKIFASCHKTSLHATLVELKQELTAQATRYKELIESHNKGP